MLLLKYGGEGAETIDDVIQNGDHDVGSAFIIMVNG